jgi:transposase
MADVMIGIDPHKSSHTAVAIGAGGERLGEVQVRACPAQAGQLLAWAQEWPDRAWAIEGAAGLGNLLAQQLAAAGERVLDVPPKLAARVRLLQSGNTGKNDPNDACSVAVAALRSKAWRPVAAEDHAVVLKIWAKRHRDLARVRNQACCRLHAVLCDLVPGGIRREISAGKATAILEQVTPSGPAAKARCELAAEFLADLRRLDAQLHECNKKLAAAVKASGTSLTGLFGVGPVIAGTVIGDVRQIFRFGSRDHFAAWNGTAPVEVSSGGRKAYRLSLRGNRRANHAIHMAAISQIRHKHSDGRAFYDKKVAEGKTHKEALRALKRRISDAIYAALAADARQATSCPKGPGGQPGNHSASRAASSHPAHRHFGQATPGPATTIRPCSTASPAPSQPHETLHRQAAHAAPAPEKPRPTT